MIYRDHFQNYKRYAIPKAQLIIADIPYNLGNNAYASNPAWYKDGDNGNGESELAGKSFFDTDEDFRPAEFMHFCNTMMKSENKRVKSETGERTKSDSPCMVVFCAFDQQMYLIDLAKKYGLPNYINLVFRKNFSAQVLKANMKIVGNCEYGLVLYRDRLPKFRNNGKMIFNCMDWPRDNESEKIHPCLPAGEPVYFNDTWMKIEDVQIGHRNRYGDVIAVSSHYAEKLVEISCGNKKTIATWNHPFLIKRGHFVFWVHADQIQEKDIVLIGASVYNTQKPQKRGICELLRNRRQKAISEQRKTLMGDCALSIVLFGNLFMDRFLSECKYITKILTRQTTTFPTFNLSRQLSISGCTLVVDLTESNGKRFARFAKSLNHVIKKIGITLGGGLTVKSANPASSSNHLQQERFLLEKVGSVRIIREKTKVYNLTIDGIPAFDTAIGVSHNTQKPIELLKTLIEIFTDEGDVVIDPVAGSGSTLVAAEMLNRKGFGFEIKKEFHIASNKWLDEVKLEKREIKEFGFAKTKLEKVGPTLWS